ncbi:MAG: sensor histidine kinase [Caldilineaceae bacterium]|nr:sensor histidine kinase [Caldilineaceae bacterium]
MLNLKRIVLNENFLLKFGAQITILSVLGLIFGVRGSLSIPQPVDQLALLLFSLLIWCRRPLAKDRPFLGVHLYLALQISLLSWLILQDVNFGLLSTILYVQAIVLARGRSRLAWLLLLLAVVVVGNFYLHPEPSMVDTPLIRAWVFQAFLVFVTLMIFNQLRARRKGEETEALTAKLMTSNRLLQEQSARIENLAAIEERERISRELHDELGHRLTAATVLIEGVRHLLSENRTQRAISTIDSVSEQLQESLTELRAIVHAFHTSKITRETLPHMLQRLTDEYSARNGTPIHTQLPDALPVSDDQSLTIFRVVQESLTNASRHAYAQNVFLTLELGASELILTVRNDGRDFAPYSGSSSYGLQGMHERAVSLGGTLTVTKPDEGGTLVTLTIPLDAEPNFPAIRKALGVNEFPALPDVEVKEIR